MFVFVLYFWLFSVFCSLTFYILIVTLNNTKANSCMWQSNLPVSDWFIEGVILKCGIPSSHFYHMPPPTPAGCQFVVANIANASCRLVYTMCCWLYKLRKRSIVLQWRRSHEVQFSLLKNTSDVNIFKYFWEMLQFGDGFGKSPECVQIFTIWYNLL